MKNTAHTTRDFSVDAALTNSVFYPIRQFDGELLKTFAHTYQSFIFCHYEDSEVGLLDLLNEFSEFEVIRYGKLRESQLGDRSNLEMIPAMVGSYAHNNVALRKIKPLDAEYAVIVTSQEPANQPTSPPITVLYVNEEPLSTYQLLYWQRRRVPKLFVNLQPPVIIDCNYEDGGNWPLVLFWVFQHGPNLFPELILDSENSNANCEMRLPKYLIDDRFAENKFLFKECTAVFWRYSP